MSQNCKIVSTEDVVKFFTETIDGMGLHDGHKRNEYLPEVLKRFNKWTLCDLTEDDFKRLKIPDNTKDLIYERTELNNFSQELLKELELGKDLPALIVREKLPENRQDASFYIEDGAHRAIALKFYFDSHPYKFVRAYIGSL